MAVPILGKPDRICNSRVASPPCVECRHLRRHFATKDWWCHHPDNKRDNPELIVDIDNTVGHCGGFAYRQTRST